jgi:predicted RNA binding protein YcfA (HicA-like mRNA interferase family)
VPKLPALTPQEIIRVLEKRGFVLDRVRGSHHIYYHPEFHRHVVVPLHHRDLPKGTFAEILRQAGLTREELSELL